MELVKHNVVTYGQIEQTMQIRFALCQETDEVLHELFYPVLCRDFLVDIVAWQDKPDSHNSIYAFPIIPYPTIERGYGYLNLDFYKQSDAFENVKKNISHIQAKEEAQGIDKTEIVYIDDNNITLKFSQFWFRNTLNFSIYTFLLRVYGYDSDPNTLSKLPDGQESQLLANVGVKVFNKVLDNIKLINDNIPENMRHGAPDNGVGTIHNLAGFMSEIKHSGKFAKIMKSIGVL